MTMPPDLFKRYEADPIGLDAEVRRVMQIPEERYYTVSIWPIPGMVTIDLKRSRAVKNIKISKSPSP